MTASLDIQDVLTSYATEIGALTQRAVIAESSVRVLEKLNTQLQADNDLLRHDLSQQLEINAHHEGDKDAHVVQDTPLNLEEPQEIPAAFKGKPKAEAQK